MDKIKSVLTKNQKQNRGWKIYKENGDTFRIKAEIRYDDQCGNGHNTFSITGEIDKKAKYDTWRAYSGGCIHDKIIKHFPELKKYIKWHLFDSTGPLHYVANTMYHAGNRDCNGLLKGEKRQLKNGRTGLLVWERIVKNEKGEEVKIGHSEWIEAEKPPQEKLFVSWEPVYTIGQGKERELDYARSSAVWPDATDEELTAPNLKEKLLERLPNLILEFKKDMEDLGFVF